MQQLDTVPNQHLGYLLESKYPDLVLTRQVLKDRDQLVVAQLENVCKGLGFYICLARLTRTVEGTHDWDEEYRRFHDMESVHTETLTLDRISNLDGSVPYDTKSLKFDEDDIVQFYPFGNDEEPDEEDYDRHYGNLTHCYRRTVCLIRNKAIALSCSLCLDCVIHAAETDKSLILLRGP
jgi:hypothetical protein